MKNSLALLLVLVGFVAACLSTSPRGPSAVSISDSGLEEVTIIAKGLE
jgi:hypothetical protein